jgi:hypothetical protein
MNSRLPWKLAATLALSAAVQRPNDPETLRTLEAVDGDAWRASPVIETGAEVLISALRDGLPEAIVCVAHEFELRDADPARLSEYCDALMARWRDFETAFAAGGDL